jgi:twinkle protein
MSDPLFRRHEPCPECGSKDNVGVWANGNEHCFSLECNYHITGTGNTMQIEQQNKVTTLTKGMLTDIPDRSITEDTCRKYEVTVEGNKHFYPLFDDAGIHVANKIRKVSTKEFYSEGKVASGTLFGQKGFPEGGKYITLCEGEIDALSAYQMLGSKWPVVSVKTGAAGAAKDVANNYDFLTSFDHVVICFDNDDAGNKAAKKVAEILSPKAKIMPLQYKDANDYLLNKVHSKFVEDWWSAKTYTPEGIIAGSEMWSTIMEGITEPAIAYPYDGLQNLTYGIRMGELITITAGAGLGKSQFIKEMVFHVLNNTSNNIGMMFMEESIKRTGLSLMSLHADKPLHLPDVFSTATDKELRASYDNTLGTDRLFFYDHFGSNEIDTIVGRVRYFAKALNCKYVVLDHISILVSDQQHGDERRALDEAMTKLRTAVQELDICLLLVSHLRRPSSAGHEEGAATSLSQLRGSASIGQLSDIVIGLERNGQHEDEKERHTTTVRVIKNRFSGLTGPACRLYYSRHTGRLTELEEEDEEFE